MGKSFVVSEHCYATAPAQGVYKVAGISCYCGCPQCRDRQGVKWSIAAPEPLSPLEEELKKALRHVKQGYADTSRNHAAMRPGIPVAGRMRTSG